MTFKMKYFALCVTLVGLSTENTLQPVPFYAEVSSDGTYSIFVNGQSWLDGAAFFVSANNKMYTSQDDSLHITSMWGENALDQLGQYSITGLDCMLKDTNNNKVTFLFKHYDNNPNVILLGQKFMGDLVNTSRNDKQSVITGFPSFKINNSLGFLAYGGLFVGDKDRTSGIWGKDFHKIKSGLDSGPLVLFNRGSDALVISPFSQFMAMSAVYDTNKNTASWGIMGSVESIPRGFECWTVMYYSSAGINKAMAEWGELLRTWYKKPGYYRESDPTINYLGYWTDNGAYYYYNPEKDNTYEHTLMDIKKYADQNKLPYKYINYDSWWYPKDNGTGDFGGGVIEWYSKRSVFPDGMQYVWNQTGWFVSAHNRMWSPYNVYSEQYIFITEKKHAIPIDTEFWTHLFRNASKWGLRTYEQDWLNVEFNEMKATTADIALGRRWLKQMGEGAANSGLTIQYCMCPSRTVLQSVEIPVVTQARATEDYEPGNDQWKLGISSIFADAVGIAPFKDNFWTTTNQSGNIYHASETAPALQSVVATLSTGPVGPSDKNGYSNVSLIMRSCNTAGLILKPSKPVMAIDAQIQKAAFKESFNGPDGELWTTYSDVSGLRFGIVLAVNMKNTFTLGPTNAHFGSNFPKSVLYSYSDASKVVPFSDSSPFVINSGCTTPNFCLFYSTPALTFRSSTVYILGEMDKWVPISPQRITGIEWSAFDMNISIKGAGLESVNFQIMMDGTMKSIKCVLSEAGTAVISIAKLGCFSI